MEEIVYDVIQEVDAKVKTVRGKVVTLAGYKREEYEKALSEVLDYVDAHKIKALDIHFHASTERIPTMTFTAEEVLL